jgi:hypothetical protein
VEARLCNIKILFSCVSSVESAIESNAVNPSRNFRAAPSTQRRLGRELSMKLKNKNKKEHTAFSSCC